MVVCLSDPLTFVISMVGLTLGIYYVLHCYFSSDSSEPDMQLKDKMINSFKSNQHYTLESALKDYEITNYEIRQRGQVILLIGSIVVASSFIILGNSTSITGSTRLTYVYAFSSIFLFLLWLLLLHETNKILNRVSFTYAKTIETALSNYLSFDFGIHKYTDDNTKASDKKHPVWWLRLRRCFWGFVLSTLSIAWLLLSF